MGEPFFSIPSIIADTTLEYGDLPALELSIDTSYKQVSRHLLGTLFEKYQLMQHLGCLKRFLLLGQGDFVGYLLDSLGYPRELTLVQLWINLQAQSIDTT